MAKTIPWGSEEIPKGVTVTQSPAKHSYSAFSSGPLIDPTPKDLSSYVGIDAFPMSSSGPPYEIPSKEAKKE